MQLSPPVLEEMPTACGYVRSSNDRLEGTFNFDGGPRYLSVDVNMPNQSFECSNATLTYSSIEKLVDQCTWTGTIGKINLRMDLGDGVSITGQLDVPQRSSVRARGAGMWTATNPSDSESSFNKQRERGRNTSADRAQPVSNPFDAPDDPREQARVMRLLGSGAPIIAIVGQSGTGKSTFINLIVSEQQKVGSGLQSCTSKVRVIEASIHGKSVVVIDTPGIDDTRAGIKEADILAGIARLLGTMGQYQVWVTGVLFLHRITDNKFSPTANRISNMLKSLCGKAAMNHLMLCTTMWDQVSEQLGNDRLAELCEMTGAWKDMVDMGASTAVISSVKPNAKKEAENIVEELITNARPVQLAIQDEMLNQGKSVAETAAGMVLTEHLREVQEEAERNMLEMQMRLRKENVAKGEEAKEALLAQEREVERLKRMTEEQTRVAQANIMRLQQEREKAERETKELQERMRKENAAYVARLQEEMRAQEREAEERMRQAEEQARAQQADAERLLQEREEADRKMKELEESMRAESQANAAKVAAAVAEYQREIDELKRQNETLSDPHHGLINT